MSKNEYIKINSLWKREGWYFDQKDKKNTCPEKQKYRQSFVEGDYSCPEFGNIKSWHVEEKIDGTNIRVMLSENGDIRFGGRTEKAQIPCHLLDVLQDTFSIGNISKTFPSEDNLLPSIILYGEGYGPKIQNGGCYRDDPGFILFDVFIYGWWLRRDDVYDIAEKLNIPHAPFIDYMSELEVVEYVKSKPQSLCSKKPQAMEGVICRSDPLMLFRDGTPVLWKLKCKDFKNLKED